MRLVLSAVAVLFSASIFSAAPALAQTSTPSSPSPSSGASGAPGDVTRMASDDCSRARALGKTCVLTIGPEEIEGGPLRPEGEVVSGRPFGDMASLIRLRRDFIPEILHSAAQVQ